MKEERELEWLWKKAFEAIVNFSTRVQIFVYGIRESHETEFVFIFRVGLIRDNFDEASRSALLGKIE